MFLRKLLQYVYSTMLFMVLVICYVNMHISAVVVCPYNVNACRKIATVVGLIQYVSDDLAVRGPLLFFHSRLMCLTTL
jgi:hypothetical protein